MVALKLAFTLVAVICLGLSVDAFKTGKDDPNRPSYIPEDYRQVETGDFKIYYEWWNRNNRRYLFYTNYNQPMSYVRYTGDESWQDSYHGQIYYVHGNNRIFFLRSDHNSHFDILTNKATQSDMAGWAIFNDVDFTKYSFVCRHYFIFNSTHVVNIDESYNKTNPKEYNGAASYGTKMQPISELKNEDCFTEEIVKDLDKCFHNNQYCAMDMGFGAPKLVTSEEQVLQAYKNSQLIMRFFDDLPTYRSSPYYVLRHQGQYYYFPQELQTYDPATYISRFTKRISMLPVMQFDDAFWSREEVKQANGEVTTVAPTTEAPTTIPTTVEQTTTTSAPTTVTEPATEAPIPVYTTQPPKPQACQQEPEHHQGCNSGCGEQHFHYHYHINQAHGAHHGGHHGGHAAHKTC